MEKIKIIKRIQGEKTNIFAVTIEVKESQQYLNSIEHVYDWFNGFILETTSIAIKLMKSLQWSIVVKN